MIRPSGIDRRETLRYMGMHGKPDAALEELLDKWEKRLLEELSPRYTHRIVPLSFMPEGILCVGTALVLTGGDIAGHLAGCGRAALLCVTLGHRGEHLRRHAGVCSPLEEMAVNGLENALVEQICDMAQEEILHTLSGVYATWRFSPGYGDLPISVQEDFLSALDAQRRLGVSLSSGGMLMPAKTVTAVIGLSEEPIAKGKRGCGSCDLRSRCLFRAKGEHCQ